jgi:stearoyl-CoA desaturase (Delta-9 desaturase)
MDGTSSQASGRGALRRAALAVRRWFDTEAGGGDAGDDGIDWVRVVPFIGMHLMCLGVYFTGVSPIALWTALALYALRMFAITAFYHRYFSHRAFRTSRLVQFVFGVIGASSVQRGPLWWAAHHRHHHRHADTEHDPHSPRAGFLRSHMGWFLTRAGFRADRSRVRDLERYPELRLLDRFDVLVPVALATALFFWGGWLQRNHPGLGTSAAQMLVWGFFVSTVVLFHATVTINSLAHRWGRRRYDTRDDSRNNAFLALITFGEGWHNNHHHFPGSARQGHRWWEIDLSWYVLCVLAALRIVSDLKAVPAELHRSATERQ